MLALHPGLFIHRLCRARGLLEAWSPPPTGQTNCDRQEELCAAVDRKHFSQELVVYREMGGQPPQFKVTLCFGEEFPDNDPVTDKLITVQVELPWARQQLEEVMSFRESMALIQELASESPLREAALDFYGIS
ncbi:interferon regulatory factor 9 [Acipenser oxyrinchus oxyrinchus]|uniref:Interferon regulatory factor 9 n=1 Tax=Acipenser oxyrinchus oxyrinchus TaxID=40147 RepID=A0AAD8CLH5_ACIOX|nr:interferon regulatory factor 9 [Acipenser oxyrinchus oxyrinchus]